MTTVTRPGARPDPVAALPDFDTVLESHGPEIYRFLRRQTPSADDAADLHQETFLRAFRAYERLTPDANVRAWLYRIASNLATDALRRRRRAGEHVPVGGADGEGPAQLEAKRADRPEDLAEAAAFEGAVRDALPGLSPSQRTAVSLRVFDGRDYDEISSLLGCSEVAARQHVSQGLRRLRSALADWR